MIDNVYSIKIICNNNLYTSLVTVGDHESGCSSCNPKEGSVSKS